PYSNAARGARAACHGQERPVLRRFRNRPLRMNIRHPHLPASPQSFDHHSVNLSAPSAGSGLPVVDADDAHDSAAGAPPATPPVPDFPDVSRPADRGIRMIEFGHLTHVGLRRDLNEDTYYGDSELGLWLVADGMGGHEYGEVASALARETIVRETRQGTPLAQAIRIADEEIIRASRQRHDTLPMGTTVVAARIGNDRFEVAWVGDSRVYL